MCIAVFIWQSHPLYPFLLLLNRDDYHNRPTKAVGWWEDGEILGGRDEVAGGTWLACTRNGRLAFTTNVMEPCSNPEAKSRGDLRVCFLKGRKSPKEFAEEVMKEADQYNGFNLILADFTSKSMVYVSNRPQGQPFFVQEVSYGIHVLSNAKLDSPWHKSQHLGENFKAFLEEYGENEVPMNNMVEELMTDTVKCNKSKLPKVCSPDCELQLSSIFVETDTLLGQCGTRNISEFSVGANNEVNFYEKYLEKGAWKELKWNFFQWLKRITLFLKLPPPPFSPQVAL